MPNADDAREPMPYRPDMLRSVDFEALYRMQYARCGLKEKQPSEWNVRAPEWVRRQEREKSPYLQRLIDCIPTDDCRTLLDIGCGNGKLILNLAAQFEHCTGLDFSRSMLAEFRKIIAKRELKHVSAVMRGWDDDWSDIPRCDLVIASRSIGGAGLPERLDKMNRWALKRAVLTYRTGPGFLPDDLMQAFGHPREARPDYIYLMNILYERGIEAELDFLDEQKSPSLYPDFETFLERVRWNLGPLISEDEKGLHDYYENLPRDPDGRRMMATASRWAVVQWKPVHGD